ncbi:MAG TPA: trypsin-like peptidase domain-containing protein [Gaiellaceae bacterium]|jgi:S1-C subfamily serine protease
MTRVSPTQVAALAVVGLLGGGAALLGAAVFGAFDGRTTTVLQTEPVSAAIPAASGGGLSVNEIYRRSAPGVVQINTRSDSSSGDALGQFGGPPQQALGSGFVIDRNGHIVTNYHVIDGADEIDVSFSNRDTLQATIVGSDPSTDLAVLKVDAGSRALTPLPLADSDRVQVGDEVVAIGNPFGLERTATAGIVSALQRAVTAPNGYSIDHVIQTDAPINQGNSGGPLLNTRGEVIGVNSQIETRSGGNVGIGFAVPSNTVKNVVAQILQNGQVDRAYLGIYARAVEPELARLFRLPVDAGLLLESVEDGSAADRAGLEGGTEQVVVSGESYRLGGDLIVAADGERVASVEALRDVLAARKPGDTIELQVYRDGKKRTVTVELGRLPTSPQG